MNLRDIIRQSDTTKQAAAVGLAVFLLLLIAWIFQFAKPWTWQAKVATPPRIAEMRFPPDEHGGCRTVKFDNQSGDIAEDRTVDCHIARTPYHYLGPFESVQKTLTGR